MNVAPTDHRADVVVVGASLAGLTTVEGLRSEGHRGSIVLIGEEDHLPYTRPPLSKQVLAGDMTAADTTMRDEAGLDALTVHYLRGERATGLDLAGRSVTVGGSALEFGRLVIATGVRARRLPAARAIGGVHVLRTVDDSAALRRDLAAPGLGRPGTGRDCRVVVVGAGVLGCEIAAATRAAGHEVTLIGRSRQPRFGQAAGHLSAMIAALLRENGIRLRMGLDVLEVLGGERVSGLRLSDGSVVPADLVVVAVGCEPATDWLRGSGLDITDGVLCDADGVAAPGIFAVGDVARWADPSGGDAVRVEHQATAIEQAHAVAHLIATGESGAPVIPFFWSELFGSRILVQGRLAPGQPLTVLAGEIADRRFVAATTSGGRTTGLVGWNMPREFRIERARMLEHAASNVSLLKGTLVS